MLRKNSAAIKSATYNRPHWEWAICTALALDISAQIWAFVYTYQQDHGRTPSGGSWWGLIFGTAAFLCMVFAALLPVRRFFLTADSYRWWRRPHTFFFAWLVVRPVRWWRRGHLWIGTLVLPLVYFHAGGIRMGSWQTLTFWLMMLLGAVFVTGVIGMVLQFALAGAVVTRGELGEASKEIGRLLQKMHSDNDKLKDQARAWQKSKKESAREDQAAPRTAEDGLWGFYIQYVHPYVAGSLWRARTSLLAEQDMADQLFKDLSATLDPARQPLVQDMRAVSDLRRSTLNAERAQWWMNSWLWLHIFFAVLLLALVVVHMIGAWPYKRGSWT